MSLRRDRGGMTMPELLFVIGIIVALASMLLPAASRARRGAMVLVSPVSYIGVDGRVHVTSDTGRTDLPSAVRTVPSACPFCHAPPSWDPSGRRIAMQLQEGPTLLTGLLDPASGKVARIQESGRPFVCWLDSERYVVGNSVGSDQPWRSNLFVKSVDGRLLETIHNGDNIVFASPAPPGAAAPYVGAIYDKGIGTVCLIRKDLTAGRRLWQETCPIAASPQGPRMDPFGEWVAWGRFDRVLLKHVKSSPQTPPAAIATQFNSVYFCDWTDGGDLLINASVNGRSWQLFVIDKGGRVLQALNTDVPPAAGAVATWRKYEHH